MSSKTTFKTYRSSHEDPETHEVDMERFAYDIFVYMLPICGFPEANIPTTIRNENTYTEDNFIMNVGLSVLPLALHMRDELKVIFELNHEKCGLHHIRNVKELLESILFYDPDYDEEDALIQIQLSLALCSEMILFFNYKGIESNFDILPKLWSQFLAKFISQREGIYKPLDYLCSVCPDVTESWITNVFQNMAIPYGSSEGVSDSFCAYALKQVENTSDGWDKKSTNESVTQESDVSNGKSEPSLKEDSKSELYDLAERRDFDASAVEFQDSEKSPTAHSRLTNGLSYLLHQRLKGRKRNRSPKLGIEDAFQEINLENENISPENRDNKRRRKLSNSDEFK